LQRAPAPQVVHLWQVVHFAQFVHLAQLVHWTHWVAVVAQGRGAAAADAEAGLVVCSMKTTSRMRAPRPATIQARIRRAAVLRGVVAFAAMMFAFFLERCVLMSSLSVI
jgi:hypothetical protein